MKKYQMEKFSLCRYFRHNSGQCVFLDSNYCCTLMLNGLTPLYSLSAGFYNNVSCLLYYIAIHFLIIFVSLCVVEKNKLVD